MRVRHKINVRIFDDAEGDDGLFAPSDTLAEVVIDNMQKLNSGRFAIAASDDEDLPFGDVADVRFVFIKADNDFTLKFNGGSEGLAIKRADAVAGTYAKFAAECDVTAVNITNPSATDVLTGVFAVYGDPEA